MESGCEVNVMNDIVRLKAPQKLKNVKRFSTNPYPGFPTDMQPQMLTLMALADGTSIIDETIFDDRSKHVAELRRMGAEIKISDDNRTFITQGVGSLRGAVVDAKDLRGGAALCCAALAAQGVSEIMHISHIERGYQDFDKNLISLGAKIERG